MVATFEHPKLVVGDTCWDIISLLALGDIFDVLF